MPENLIQGTIRELNRARELLAAYAQIPTGSFGEAQVRQAIIRAEAAMGSGDVVELVRAYKLLTELK